MIINDFYMKKIISLNMETYAILVINSNAVLSRPVTLQ